MREKEVKVDKNHRIQNKFNPYSITIGLILVVFSLILLFITLWGLMNTFKHPDQYYVDPSGWIDFSYFKTPFYYQNSLGEEGEISGIFTNYIAVFKNMRYDYAPSYYLGWNLEQEVMKEATIDYPNGGTGVIAWLWFLWNSVWTCFAGTVLPMVMCAIVGYTCAKYKYKFSGFVYSLVVFTMVLPQVGTQPVTITLLQRIRFFDNPVGYLIWNCNFASMYFMIFFSFYQGLSDSYFEAAEIDGASQLRMLVTIAIPLAKTMFAATFVVHFIDTWTNYNTVMVYLPSHPTIAYGIHYCTVVLQEPAMQIESIKLAALMCMALPALTFFTIFRKQLMGNISIGGIKE